VSSGHRQGSGDSGTQDLVNKHVRSDYGRQTRLCQVIVYEAAQAVVQGHVEEAVQSGDVVGGSGGGSVHQAGSSTAVVQILYHPIPTPVLNLKV
jgi:hypothetical protein